MTIEASHEKTCKHGRTLEQKMPLLDQTVPPQATATWGKELGEVQPPCLECVNIFD